VAKKYISPDKLAIVVVGDAGEVLPQVKAYSKKIEVFDADGKSIDVASYENASTGAPADANGKWTLMLETPGQKVPVTLMLKQEGDKVTGSLDSMLGKSDLSTGKVSGSKFVGTSKTQIQGQDVELNISGTINGDMMKGVVNTGIPGFPPFPFEGKREGGANKPM
jgi:hypothetical protein